MTILMTAVATLAGVALLACIGRQWFHSSTSTCVTTAEAKITISLLPVLEGMVVEPPTPDACLTVSLLPDQSADLH